MKTVYNFKKSQTEKKYSNRFVTLLFFVILSLSMFLLCGCNNSYDNVGTENLIDRSFFEQYVDGFNVVYADKENDSYSGLNEDQNQIGPMAASLQNELIYNYGSGRASDVNESATAFSDNAPFPDSIRMLVTAKDGDKYSAAQTDLNYHWNWLINPFTNPTIIDINPQTTTVKNIDTANYSTWQSTALYYLNSENKFSKSYSFETFSPIFQIVLYEIMLGYEPTTVEIVYRDASGEKFVDPYGSCYILTKAQLYEIIIKFSDETKSDLKLYSELYDLNSNATTILQKFEGNAKEKVESYLNSLKTIYEKTARYTGLTKQNADKLIDYILNEVVGSELIAYDFNTYKSQPVNYRNYISTIAHLIYGHTYDGTGDDWVYEYKNSETGINLSYTFSGKYVNENGETVAVESGNYSSKATTYLQYFDGKKFFGAFDGADQFTDIAPYLEYQSVVVIPAVSSQTIKDGGLALKSGFVYNFMSKNRELRIRATVRYYYYDKTTQTGHLYEFKMNEINFTDGANTFVNKYGETCYEKYFEMKIDIKDLEQSIAETSVNNSGYRMTSYTVDFFDNEYIFENNGELEFAQDANIQNIYKVVPSENGFGAVTILNEKKIQFSFFEIALDVVKSASDPADTDYKFSMVLSNKQHNPGIM